MGKSFENKYRGKGSSQYIYRRRRSRLLFYFTLCPRIRTPGKSKWQKIVLDLSSIKSINWRGLLILSKKILEAEKISSFY